MAIPAARLATAADTIDSMPAAAVGFPRHFGLLADFGDFQIAGQFCGSGGEIVRFALDVRTGGENGGECCCGVGDKRADGPVAKRLGILAFAGWLSDS